MKRILFFLAFAYSSLVFAVTPIQLTLSDDQVTAIQAIIDANEKTRDKSKDDPKNPPKPPTPTEYFTTQCAHVADAYLAQYKATVVNDAKTTISELDPTELADVIAYIESKKKPKTIRGR